MLFELVVLVVGVFHYRDFCLEGMQLAPELSDSCRNRLYRRHEYLELRDHVCQHWRLRRLQGVQPLRPWRERDLRGTLVVALNLGRVMAPRAVVSIDSLPASGRFTVTGGVGFPRTTLAQDFAAFWLSTVVFPGFDHTMTCAS